MELGISSACYYPVATEEAVGSLARAGVATIEIFLNTFSELEKEYLLRLREEMGSTQAVSVHPFTSGLEPFLFFTGYDRRYEDGISLYMRYFEACALLGARYLVFHGDRRESNFEEQRYFERFALLRERASEFEVELLQENVARCRSHSPAFIRRMRQALCDQVGFVLDTKQCLRSSVTAAEMLAAMGSCVKHVHISDSDPTRDCLPPGEGEFDFHEFRRQLRDYSFDGAVLIELYRQNYADESDLLASFQNLNRAFR